MKLPLRVRPVVRITFAIEDADGNMIGETANEREAYQIKKEIESECRDAVATRREPC